MVADVARARNRPVTPLPAVVLAIAAACSSDAKVDSDIVKAVSTENKTDKAREELDKKAAQDAKKKREATMAAQAARAAAIDEAAQVPEPLPESLEVACEAVVNAYDMFMKAGTERDALEWSDGRRRKLGERRAACLEVGKLPVAACEVVALGAAPEALADLPRKEAARLLMERCHEKFG